jgi:hypothetical protein
MHRNSCSGKTPILFRLYKYVLVILIGVLILHLLYENSSAFYRTAFVMPFSLHLNKYDIYMLKGEETRLTVFGINKRVSYYSTNFRVAGVNFNGRIHAYRTGKAFIIAKVDGKQLKCRVHVIDINKNKLVIKKGDCYRLKIAGSSTFIHWKSSNTKVASVSIFGNVKANCSGGATITAKVKGRTLQCRVIVK